MYQGRIKSAAAFLALFVIISGALLTGCEAERVADDVGNKISESVSDTVAKTKQQVGDELKKAFVSEVQAFMANNDWAEALGISAEEQKSISDSIQGYVDSYELEEEQLESAKTSVEELLENAKGLSVEEIKQNIAEIFEKQK